ncbi:sigma-54-dependent Fis family transcriptional regulator [Anabaena cylindrica FACHB-243]|uniref:Phytochrome sensor protein n=1 Tax=Anabaena cylindrica (strain ATCC 27899 / PCC 7122) TaxID=272123 RepID=K9ZJ14_ANACC|nr:MULTISPECIES: GAF domain-containing protein [Anabaena]AFZ59208.1 putative phytochrome sensor protein [Anabaena cylindrica PCC 7122]MBD2416558.1 sigma-54-dependent Fis family transcriptional regulator [Anabaena cylindrica FACHB-243]MBY5280943.1 sigma-54-dependent Fis family transcriptional regulator [Anabaena sp. CCAP 1446/1C]MBY5311616.1 sigma-54-dependent Fis family transcriptional regulator [Anabaena sp. CCAP 1446/1C]MCM2407498.1 sigma-54-dependent Fis family transcriptional regulator [An
MSHRGNNAVEAGHIYTATGRISAEMLRSEIYRAWERSHLQGANNHALQAEKLSSLETERLVEQHSDLINVATPYFRTLSQAAGRDHHAVMLSDRRGILLNVAGDKETIQGSESFPRQGSLLSEAVAGANGIGTPLAEENYVEIVAAEHFIQGFHPFTCQGIPLRDENREILGVLSISVRRPDAGQRLKEILICASHGIEAELLIGNLEKQIRRVLTSNPDDYQPLEELRQDIIQGHQAARLKLEIGSRMVAVNCLDYAIKLLQQAEKSIQIFRHRAAIWRNLASLEIGAIQHLSLTDILQDLVDILATEAAIRKVEIFTDWTEQIIVTADVIMLSRKLLRCFLNSFERAGKSGAVKVIVEKMPYFELVQVSFTSIPGFNTSKSEPITEILSLPISKGN